MCKKLQNKTKNYSTEINRSYFYLLDFDVVN